MSLAAKCLPRVGGRLRRVASAASAHHPSADIWVRLAGDRNGPDPDMLRESRVGIAGREVFYHCSSGFDLGHRWMDRAGQLAVVDPTDRRASLPGNSWPGGP